MANDKKKLHNSQNNILNEALKDPDVTFHITKQHCIIFETSLFKYLLLVNVPERLENNKTVKTGTN